MTASVTFFPVDCGDMSLLKLADSTGNDRRRIDGFNNNFDQFCPRLSLVPFAHKCASGFVTHTADSPTHATFYDRC